MCKAQVFALQKLVQPLWIRSRRTSPPYLSLSVARVQPDFTNELLLVRLFQQTAIVCDEGFSGYLATS
jgi:hypothetical protein